MVAELALVDGATKEVRYVPSDGHDQHVRAQPLGEVKPSERAASEPLDPSVPTTIVAIGPSLVFRPDHDASPTRWFF
jgi:hypothetical protein